MKIFDRVFARQKPQSAPAPPTRTYAMNRTGMDSAEIVLYGDIVSARPTDWDGNPVEGQYIILSEFLEDMKQVEDVNHLTVRIHSAGGNAYDAMTIHNRLKSLAADVTVIVDGVAMSGGSLIMAAGDRVQVYPGSLVMIHCCWSFLFGGYNAAELRKMAESNDAVDRSQAAIYHAKTGIDTEELLSMMEAETYLTGREAVDMGFADELVEGESVAVAASADRHTLFAGGVPVWVTTRKGGIPDSIPTVKSEAPAPAKTNTNQPVQTGNEGGKTMAKNLEELRAENPELAEALMAEAKAAVSAPAAGGTPPAPPAGADDIGAAVQAEQRRIQEIDELAGLYDAETVKAAKYGENACTAQEMAYRAAQKAAQQGRKFLNDLDDDTQASGAQGVPAAGDPGTPPPKESQTPDQRMATARAEVKALFGKKEEK